MSVSAVLLAAAGGCGDSGRGAETDPEKGSDAAILNEALSRELTLRDAYTQGRRLLGGSQPALARQLRAHEQEYVNALTKAIRGLGGDTEAAAAEVDLAGVREASAFLSLAYELESAALASYVEVAPQLYTDAPRTLAASLATGHGQHLVALRHALGEGPATSIPEAFDGGEVPPPAGEGPGGGG